VARLETLETRTVLSSVSGVGFHDANANGLRDAGEEGLVGEAVYLDQNNSGTLDPGEPSTTTDPSGEYSFDGLSTGEYVVREVVPDGHRQTAPLYGELFYAYTYVPNSGGQMQPARIDPATGDVLRLGTPATGDRLHGLVRTNDGSFYGMNGYGSDRLFSLDINTNVKTEIAQFDTNVAWGMVYDPASDTIYVLGRDPLDDALKLASVNRSTGELTFFGDGTYDMTGTSGLAWDPEREVVIGFDNGDDQFWEFDTAGNTKLLWDTSGLNGWGFSHNGNDFSLLSQVGDTSDTFWEIDPYAQTAVLGLQASEPIPMESLDYFRVNGGHLVYVGDSDAVTGLDFANEQVVNALIGIKFNDVDGNGVQDPGEQGTEDVVVYLDQNNNAELDPGEQSTTTDTNGEYIFNRLPVGEYVVREALPEGYRQTAPLYGESFYAYMYVPGSGGLMQPGRFDPQTGEVQRLGTPATGDRLHGLVRTNDGSFYGMNGYGSDRFFSLDFNTNVKTEIGQFNTNVAWGMAYAQADDTIYVLGRDPLDNALKLASVDRTTGELTFFGVGTYEMTGTSGLAWDPEREVVIGFDNSDDQFWQFDTAGNAELLWDTSGLNGWGFSYNGNNFSLLSQVGEGSDTFWEIDPYAQTAVLGLQASEPIPMESLDYYRVDGGHLAYVSEGEVVTDLDFGNREIVNALIGTKYQDLDGNGVRDTGEPGMAGVVVYLDQNNNGVMDPGEQSTTTDESGEYLFNGLPVGEYVVREIIPEGYLQTAPQVGESFYAYARATSDSGYKQLCRIDPQSGQVQRLGPPAVGDTLHGLIHTNSGEFFGVNETGFFNDRLFQVDVHTNETTQIGVVNGEVAPGLAYDPATDTIYALGSERPGAPLKLATVDRTTGQLTFLGSGTRQLPFVAGLAWDPEREVVVAFDNSDGQFWEFDRDGNATLIWQTPGLFSRGLAYNGTSFSMPEMIGVGTEVFWEIDPYAQTQVLGLQLSEGIVMEAIDYYHVEGGHLAYVAEGGVVTGLDFGNEEIVNALVGAKFNDIDGNGLQDPGELGTEDVTVYLDQNNNGELDPGEQSTTTDANGDYIFNKLPVGEYVVREVVPEGYRQTAPLYGESFYAYAYVPSSGGQMQPARIDPATGDVLRVGTPATGDRLHGLVRTNDGEFFGLNGWGQFTDRFFSLDFNTNVKTEIGAINGDVAWGLAYDPASDTIYTLARESVGVALKLASVDRTNGQLTFIGAGTSQMAGTSGLAWDSERGVLIGFDNSDDQFWQFDTAGNASLIWDTAGLDGWGLAYNGTNLSLFARLIGGNDSFWNIDPYAQTAVLGLQASEAIPMEALDYYRVDGGHLAYISEGDVVTGLDFANQRIPGMLTGTKFEDLDGDGVRDPGEPGMEGVVIYLDSNNNGLLDPGEQSAITEEDGQYLLEVSSAGEYTVREIIPDGYHQTAPLVGEAYYAYLYVPSAGGLMQPGRIDPQTGEVLRLGTPDRNDRLHGLIRTNDGEFFGLNGYGQFTDRFFSLDFNTNERTEIGAINGDVAWGLAYDAAGDTIYALAREAPGGPIQLATVDRTTGQFTYIGAGTSEMTGTSGLAWDPDRDVLVAFDNSDDQFWEFDTSGSATLIWQTSGLNGWGFAHNGTSFSLLSQVGEGSDTFWEIDPYAQTAVLGLQASEPIPMESLDYFRVDGGHLVYVADQGLVSGLDFGNQVNLPPVADAGGPYIVNEGGLVSLDGSASFDPEGYPLELLWDLDGDGVFGDEVGATPDFSAAGMDGPISIDVELKVIDDLGAFDIASTTIEILNVAPAITEIASDATFDDLGAEDAAVTVTASFIDAGTPDTHTATIDWGDGSLPESATVTKDGGSGTVSASHPYADGGVFTVTLTVTDDDTGEAVATTQTVVVGAGINNGVLQIVGDDEDNCALVTKFFGHIIVGTDFFSGWPLRVYDASSVDAIQMWLGDGDDHGLITGNVRIPYTMVGGDGDDILKGGGGRGILIGGLGADRLTGGRDDDILIGGTTDYDSNDVALLALLTEWNSDRSYEDRVANINNGTGPLLDDLGFLLDGDTVHDDVDLDRLVGGRGDDWFFGTDDEIRGHGCR
jgi:SdrD B-like protein/PKD domain-containing protein